MSVNESLYFFGAAPGTNPATGSQTIFGPYPALSFSPSEPNGLYETIQEVAGDWWFVTNAAFNPAIGFWQQNNGLNGTQPINDQLPAYAWVYRSSGFVQRLAAVATGNPTALVAWTNVFQIDPAGNVAANGLALTTPLPIASGGTGSGVQNFVDLTTTQTINGNKTFAKVIAATLGLTAAGPVEAPTIIGDTSVSSPLIAASTEVTSPLFASPNGNGVLALYNVKDYGAVGNGTTDDSTAILAARAAAVTGGGVLFFPGPPNGNYLYNSATAIDVSGCSVRAEAGALITAGSTAVNCFVITNASSRRYWLPNIQSFANAGIALSGVGGTLAFNHIYVQDIVNCGIGVFVNGGTVQDNIVEWVTIAGSGTAGRIGFYVNDNGGGTSVIQGNRFRGNFINGCQTGIFISSTTPGATCSGINQNYFEVDNIDAGTSLSTSHIKVGSGISLVGGNYFRCASYFGGSGASASPFVSFGTTTTSAGGITAGSAQVVTPASMTNIVAGSSLGVSSSGPYEAVLVLSTTLTTFTANFQSSHGGPVLIYVGVVFNTIIEAAFSNAGAPLPTYASFQIAGFGNAFRSIQPTFNNYSLQPGFQAATLTQNSRSSWQGGVPWLSNTIPLSFTNSGSSIVAGAVVDFYAYSPYLSGESNLQFTMRDANPNGMVLQSITDRHLTGDSVVTTATLNEIRFRFINASASTVAINSTWTGYLTIG